MWKKISFVWNKGAVECFEHVYRYILYKDQGVEFESYCHDSNDDRTTTAKGNAMEMVELHRIVYKALVFLATKWKQEANLMLKVVTFV